MIYDSTHDFLYTGLGLTIGCFITTMYYRWKIFKMFEEKE